jgi:hypothetical protein
LDVPIHQEENPWNPEHRLERRGVYSPYRNAKRALFAVFLGDVYSPQRLGMVVSLPQRVDGVDLLVGSIPDDPVYSWGVLALVFRHSSDSKGFAAE